MNVISVIIGIVSLVICLIGLIPVLGWLEWISLALCMVGTIFGIFGDRKSGMNLNLVVGVVAIFRLVMGGGIL
jgi:hypothetical protein